MGVWRFPWKLASHPDDRDRLRTFDRVRERRQPDASARYGRSAADFVEHGARSATRTHPSAGAYGKHLTFASRRPRGAGRCLCGNPADPAFCIRDDDGRVDRRYALVAGGGFRFCARVDHRRPVRNGAGMAGNSGGSNGFTGNESFDTRSRFTASSCCRRLRQWSCCRRPVCSSQRCAISNTRTSGFAQEGRTVIGIDPVLAGYEPGQLEPLYPDSNFAGSPSGCGLGCVRAVLSAERGRLR